MSIDPETGFPTLPPGYRWEVRSFTSTRIRVTVQKLRLFGWFDTNTWWSVRKIDATRTTIRVAAESALTYYPRPEAPSRTEAWKQFVGVYPPKTLGD